MKDYTNNEDDMNHKDEMSLEDRAKMLMSKLDSYKLTNTSASNGIINTGVNSHSHNTMTTGYDPFNNTYFDYDNYMKGLWTTTTSGAHSHSIYNTITCFSKAQFSKNIMESGLPPFELLLETYKSHSHDAFFDAFMYARDISIVDKRIFDVFVFDKKQHALYSACPEYQTFDDTIRMIAEVKSVHIVAYLREDIRDDPELKREINIMKLKGYFD